MPDLTFERVEKFALSALLQSASLDSFHFQQTFFSGSKLVFQKLESKLPLELKEFFATVDLR